MKGPSQRLFAADGVRVMEPFFNLGPGTGDGLLNFTSVLRSKISAIPVSLRVSGLDGQPSELEFFG